MTKELWRVTRTATAWESIGHDGDTFRIKGGRALYDAVMYDDARSRTNTVRLARLGNYHGTKPVGIEQHNRRVGPDTVLEFMEPITP
jgi:hypothetical protein